MVSLTAEGQAALILGSIILALDVLAVLLRVCARRSKNVCLGADDYWILFALPLEFAYVGLLFWGVIGGGGGRGITELTIDELITLFKVQYIADFFINTICTTVKLSILCLYKRIFDVKPFRVAANALGGLCLVWYIVTMSIGIILCLPISAFWTVGPEGPYPASHCIDFPRYFVCVETLNIFLDVLILCLPIRMIWKLHLPIRQKVILGGIFLLGSFVCVTGLLRIIMDYRPGRNVPLILLTDFSVLETGVAIICACLPTFRPLIADFSFRTNGLKQWYIFKRPADSNSDAVWNASRSQLNKPVGSSSNNPDSNPARGGHQVSGIAIHSTVEVV